MAGALSPTRAPQENNRREFVLGSRPPDLYSPRIKPVSTGPGTRQYGKGQSSPERQANLGGVRPTPYATASQE